ncbi:helix-turn-helix domain-containing protein [Gordonia sp. DT30]|uniref:helix-turn-helix domain-containing protein n=1 Tax=unclassified Gordonia (in: high G+C Gram-positive bacteria) TaxID=2657482 RepID=UPI003CFB5B5B
MNRAGRPQRPATLWRNHAPAGEAVILPDGCMDLIWTGDDLLVAGPDTVANTFRTGRPRDMTGLRFAPGHAPGLLGIPASEFRDLRIRLSDVWPAAEVGRWSEMLSATDNVGAMLVELCAARPGEPAPPWIGAATEHLRHGTPVAACADAVSVSVRTLHRVSLQCFGYGPKTLARILRMRAALTLITGTGRGLSEVAQHVGYADYAHMYREFVELAGAPPTAFTDPDQAGAL